MTDLLSAIDAAHIVNMSLAALPRVFAAMLVLVVFWVLQRVTQPVLRAIMRRADLDEALIRILVDNLYRATLLVVGLVMAASQIGIDVTAALAGISVAGLAVGFAAQDSLANIIAGLLIFWDKPFRVGEYITMGDQYGRIVEITMRSTRIRTQENTYVIIPNKHIIDTVVVNHSKHGDIRVNVPIGIAYKESIPEARRVLLAAAATVEHVLPDPAPDVVVEELAGSSVNLLMRVWVSQADKERVVFFRTLEAGKLVLDAAGIQIPYPHLQLFVDDVATKVFEKSRER